MNIIELVKKYIGETVLEPEGNGIWSINLRGGLHNGNDWTSLRIWEHTNSYYHWREQKGGGAKSFAYYVLGLSSSVVEEMEFEDYNAIAMTVRELETSYHKRDYNIFDIIGEPGYNDYISSRNITEETAKQFGLELDEENVVIPLHDNSLRVGSIIRYNTVSKSSRYRTFLINQFDKPDAWPHSNLKKLNSDSIVVLFEGAWSVMRFTQVVEDKRFVPFATLGTKLSDSLKMKLFEYPIIGVLDDDNGGEKVAKQLEEWKLEGLKTYTYIPKHVSKIDQILLGPLYADELSDKEILEMVEKLYAITGI